MKKLVTLMLGMSLLFGTVSVMFGEDQAPQTEQKKKKKGKKKAAPKKEEGKQQ
jgi:hypothetical protein